MHALTITDSLVAAPEVSALSLAYVKQHIKALGTADDTLTKVWIDAATSYFEEQTNRQVMRATYDALLDAFPFQYRSGIYARIELPHPPLLDVLSVQYVDSNGDLVSFDDGESPTTPLWTYSAPVGPYARRGFVEPKYGVCWPIARQQTGAVRIRYTCGYGALQDPVETGGSVPDLIAGILAYLTANFDQTRQSTAFRGGFVDFPIGIKVLLDGFKYTAYPTQELKRDTWWNTFAPPGSWPWR